MKVLKTILFWFLSLTWGLIMTLIGLVGYAVLTGSANQSRYYLGVHSGISENWGGVSLGPFIFTGKSSSEATKKHELGHSIQNIILGPLFPFIIGIPSAIRCGYYNWYYKYKFPKTQKDLRPYDSIWFEHWATRLGERLFK